MNNKVKQLTVEIIHYRLYSEKNPTTIYFLLQYNLISLIILYVLFFVVKIALPAFSLSSGRSLPRLLCISPSERLYGYLILQYDDAVGVSKESFSSSLQL